MKPPASNGHSKQPEMLTIYAERSVAEDGTITIKPVRIMHASEEVTIAEAAKILGLSARRVNAMCDEGHFASAHRPSSRPKSHWRLSRREVLARKTPSAY